MTDVIEGSSAGEHFRAPNGRYSTIEAEIKRLDQVHSEAVRAGERLASERDRRLDDRFKGQETATAAALAAAEKAVAAALSASEKAISKAEIAQQTLISAQAREITELRSRLDIGPPSLSILQTRSDEAIGRRGGVADSRALLFSIIGALAAGVVVLGFILAMGQQ